MEFYKNECPNMKESTSPTFSFLPHYGKKLPTKGLYCAIAMQKTERGIYSLRNLTNKREATSMTAGRWFGNGRIPNR